MPNWCNNKLTIYGTEHALTSFMTAAATPESKFSMGVFFPLPEELANTSSPNRAPVEEQERLKEKYGAADWYDWALANWGCKWDFSVESMSEDLEEGEVEFDFDTAWGPPDKFMERLAAEFPSLTFVHMYAESGMGFGGMVTYKNGDVQSASMTDASEDTSMLSEWHAHMMGEDWNDTEQEADEDEDETNEGGE
jgi:hypothetical protein